MSRRRGYPVPIVQSQHVNSEEKSKWLPATQSIVLCLNINHSEAHSHQYSIA